jgi:CheY-like chemotaxis protein
VSVTTPPASLAGRAILLVEDDYFIVKALRRQFEREGATVVGPASNVADALELLRTAPRIDAAVLDVNLQGEMVFPVAAALAERGVPFVFATGYDATVIPPQHAAVRHCSKPVEPKILAEALFG